jgi:hypothetical protein
MVGMHALVEGLTTEWGKASSNGGGTFKYKEKENPAALYDTEKNESNWNRNLMGSYDFIASHAKQKEEKVLRTLIFIGAQKNNTMITIPEPCRQSAMLLYKSWRNYY